MSLNETESAAPPSMSAQIGKFIISAFAVACAAILPRAMSALATTDPNSNIELFSGDYLLLSFLVAVTIGAAVMLTQWYQPCRPPRIFIAALAFPSLISGGLNMTLSVNELEAKDAEILRVSKDILKQDDIPVSSEPIAVQPLQVSGSDVTSPPKGLAAAIGIVSEAKAQTSPTQTRPTFSPGQLVREPQYLVVIYKATNREEALNELRKFRQFLHEAGIVSASNNTFYVVASPRFVPLSQASTQAVRVKRRLAEAGFPNAAVSVQRVR